MTFLNGAVLVGLTAVAIPILIHLLHRRQARVVEWGAMRFLLDSLASRSRRVLLEDMLLMVLRCLLVAVLVMAVARPFVPSRSAASWLLVLPAVLVAAVLAAVGAVIKARRMARWLLLALAGALVVLAVGASVMERLSQSARWAPAGGGKDLAVVIDGSMSMTLAKDGRSSFEVALEEARAALQTCGAADTATIILAGPAPRAPVVGPTSDQAQVAAALNTLSPAGGSMGLLSALEVAGRALAQGHNADKKIVLITDGQDVGWDAGNDARWRFLADGFRQLPAAPQLVCRMLPLPDRYANAAVADVAFSRAVVGTDRPVEITVRILNSGTSAIEPSAVELAVDGSEAVREAVGAMEPQAVEAVRFEHRFESPGFHTVSVRLPRADDMPGDNADARVLNVLARLPVLIVDGTPSARPFDGAGFFIATALAPREAPAEQEQGGAGGYLVEPTIVPITAVADVRDFGQYAVVVLANVSRLPSATARALAAFVREGGGLLIAPGNRAALEFYNAWTAQDAGALMPASLIERVEGAEKPARLALETFSHPAVAVIAGQGNSDGRSAALTSYWRLEADPADGSVRVAALMDTGSPFLVERKVGKGYVLMAAASLDRHDSNLPGLKCFVPLVHELTQYLAAPTMADYNLRPGTPIAFDLPADGAGRSVPGASQLEASLTTPSGQTQPLALLPGAGAWRVSFPGAGAPGLYRISFPWLQGDAGAQGGPAAAGVPFAVLRDPAESTLRALTEADLERVGRHVNLFAAKTTGEMTAALAGNVPGREVWKYLALCALAALIAEVAVARWVTGQRRTHTAEQVSFGTEPVSPQSLRDKLWERPASSAQEAGVRRQ